MALVDILDVTIPRSGKDRLAGCSIDLPRPNTASDIYEIQIGGWALGHHGPPQAIEIMHGDRVLRKLALNIPRGAVADLFPHIPKADQCGFWTSCGVAGLSDEFEIGVDALLGEDAGRVHIGTIRGRHQPVRSAFSPTLQPIMVTSLGRTGTTWLMRLLSQHPAIAVHSLFPYEVKCAGYWIHMFTVLGEPANHAQSAHPDTFEASPFWVGNHPYHSDLVSGDSSLRTWFGRTYVEDLAGFCQRNIENFYVELSRFQRRKSTVYFAEKHVPGSLPRLIWNLYPKARELFLVRDFRDMLCSIFAFNGRRGFPSFGRERTPNDEAYIRLIADDARKLLESWKERAGRASLVRYEDLIREPESTLEAILAYLNIDRHSSTIQKMLESASADTNEVQRHRTTVDAESSIGRWRRELSPPLVPICEEVFADLLSEFGYAV